MQTLSNTAGIRLYVVITNLNDRIFDMCGLLVIYTARSTGMVHFCVLVFVSVYMFLSWCAC